MSTKAAKIRTEIAKLEAELSDALYELETLHMSVRNTCAMHELDEDERRAIEREFEELDERIDIAEKKLAELAA